MQIRSQRPPGWFWIDWWLTNHCSWRCSYCPSILRSGSIPLIELKDCQRFLDQVDDYCRKRNLRLNINFTGGEVSEWPHLPDLLSYAKRLAATINIRTNANTDAEQWQLLIEPCDSIEMIYHPEHTQHSRFLMNLARTIKADKSVRVVIMMLPDRFDHLENIAADIEKKFSISVERKMVFDDTAFNQQPKDYDQDQIAVLKNQSQSIRDERSQEDSDYQTMVLEQNNKFQGMLCYSGIEQIIVDAWGKVNRSHCRQRGSLGHISGDIRWPTEPMICAKDSCVNAFDILSTKESI